MDRPSGAMQEIGVAVKSECVRRPTTGLGAEGRGFARIEPEGGTTGI